MENKKKKFSFVKKVKNIFNKIKAKRKLDFSRLITKGPLRRSKNIFANKVDIKNILNKKQKTNSIKNSSDNSKTVISFLKNNQIIKSITSKFTLEKFKTSDMPLKTQLLVMFMIMSILPVILMGAITYTKVAIKVNESQEHMLSAFADGIQGNIDTLISSSENILKGLSAQTDMVIVLEDVNTNFGSTGEVKDVTRLNKIYFALKNAVKSSENLYETIFITDLKGRVIADGSQYREQYTKMNISEAKYFKKLMAGEKFVVGEPVKSKATGRIVIPVAKTVETMASKMGVIVVMFDLEKFIQPIENVKTGETGYAYIVNKNGTIIFHKDKNRILDKIENQLINTQIERLNTGEKVIEGFGDYNYQGVDKVAYYKKVANTDWLVVTALDKSEYVSSVETIRNFIFLMIVLLVLISFIVALVYSRSVTAPISKLAQLMKQVSQGHLDVKADFHTSREIGILNDSFNHMLDNLQVLINKITSASLEVANAAENLTKIASDAYGFTRNVSEAIEEIAVGAHEQASDIKLGADKIDILANTMDDVNNYTSLIMDTSSNADKAVANGLKQVSLLSEKSKESSAISENIYNEVVELNAEIKRVERIINTITNISQQTNLLALNAAIEAARAGEAGRGFSVVADEVRKLAEQTANEAQDIQNIITSIEQKAEVVGQVVNSNEKVVEEQNNAVEDTKKAFQTIFTSIQEMTKRIENIDKSIQNMNAEKVEIINTISNISKIANKTADGAENANSKSQQQFATVEQIKYYADDLSELANNLKDSIKRFQTNN